MLYYTCNCINCISEREAEDKRRLKHVFGIILSLNLIVFTSFTAFASDNTYDTTTQKSSLNEVPFSEGNISDKDQLLPVAVASSVNYEEEYLRAKNGISDIPITEDILNSFEAVCIDSNNITEELNVYLTVRELGTFTRSKNPGTIYSLSAFASNEKTDSGSEKISITTTYGNLVWIDNFGPGNELVKVSGGWSTTSQDEITGKSVSYGVNDVIDPASISKNPTEDTFSYNGTSSMVGLVLYLETISRVNGHYLRLRVINSIFT